MATALITGASSGIGYELAKRFAADGHNIILVARDKARLRQVAKELSLANDVDVVYIACDLTDPKCWAEVALAAREHGPVDVLVNDAGLGKHGDFAKVDLNDHLYVLHTNITALTVLTKLLLPQIVRRKGKILNLASIASYQPGPHMAVYYATKAYVLSFSESLHEELKGKGVTVTALAGPTESRFADRSKMRGTRAFKQLRVMDPAEVAQQGYDALMGGERVRVPGAQNKAIVAATRVGTAAMRAKLSKKTLERK